VYKAILNGVEIQLITVVFETKWCTRVFSVEISAENGVVLRKVLVGIWEKANCYNQL
jgi:hypothetical protein